MPSTFTMLIIALLIGVAAQTLRQKQRFGLASLLIAMTIICVVFGVIGAMR
jgi:hypothetical protein